MTETNNPSSSNPPRDSHPSTQNPSTVEPPHAIELESVKDSKIISVSLYNGRAEVTRLFTTNVKVGLNQLQVKGLPGVLIQDSFRVEGRGAATIHDVTLSPMPPSLIETPSPGLLEELTLSKEPVEKALSRAKRSMAALESYLSTANAKDVDVTKLADLVKNYDDAAAGLDNKITELEKQKKIIETRIADERGRLTVNFTGGRMPFQKASIGVFADYDGEIKIVLIYAVTRASWTAGYDVRVNMQKKEKPVQIFYKGAITQSTGEDWDNVPLTLETVNPTFGLSVPTLNQWRLSVYEPPIPAVGENDDVQRVRARMTERYLGMPLMRRVPDTLSSTDNDVPNVHHRGANISSRGTVSATFSVPGLITVPSDGVAHKVTITELELDATMSWLCVPKKDTKTHIKATIKNASEYTLLPGSASVYVDGSFISKTAIPLVSPSESFDCPLGLDPSIRVTYHPRSKKVSQSGFYNKSTNYTFQQRITIQNTKTHAIQGYKVLDQFPISEDSNITVKHISPPLVLPSTDSDISGGIGSGKSGDSLTMNISQGVVAQWDGAEEAERGEIPMDSVGKEGKVAWICSIPASSKLGLLLHWEVIAPIKTEITGL